MAPPSNVPRIELKGVWNVRMPATGYKPADGHRVCTDVVIYAGGPWVSFTWEDPQHGPVEMFVSRPCVITPFHDERKAASDPTRELPGLKEALLKDSPAAPRSAPPRLRSVRP